MYQGEACQGKTDFVWTSRILKTHLPKPVAATLHWQYWWWLNIEKTEAFFIYFNEIKLADHCIRFIWSRWVAVYKSTCVDMQRLYNLKMKTIHKCFLCPYKRQSSLLCFIATMQVKRDIGKIIIHKLPILNEHMCLCWVSTLFGMICCLL